jgi:hypothetical protein
MAMRLQRSVMRAKPPTFIIQLFVITLSIFLLGGGIYNILKDPFIAIPLQGRWFFYYPYTIHEQSYIESLITMILLAIGATGFLLTYQSTRYLYKPRQGVALLTIGFALIFIAYYALEQGIRLKLTAPY